jgi:hypothetical protein
MPLFTRPARRRRSRKPTTRNVDGLSSYELSDDEKERRDILILRPEDYDVIDPRDSQLVPKAGAWIMIVRPLPPMEFGMHEHIRVGRVFYAEHQSNADDAGFVPDGSYKVNVNSPWGSVTLWPYEYSVIPVDRILTYWQEGALTFHPQQESVAQFNAIVFYARQRCIGLADAMVMALGSLAGPVGWFEPATPELAVWMEGMGEELHESINSPKHLARRAAAREKMVAQS